MKKLLIGCGLLLLFVGGLFVAVLLYFGIPAYRRAVALSTLSTAPIDVSMHNPASLQPYPWYSPLMGANIRLPATLSIPAPEAMPEARYAFLATHAGDISFHVATMDRGTTPFLRVVSNARRGLLNKPNVEAVREGNAQIAGMHAYVLEYRITGAAPIHGRFMLIEGPDTTVFILMGVAHEASWPAYADVVDSAASTFALGPPPALPPQEAAAPIAPAPPAAAAPTPPFSVQRDPLPTDHPSEPRPIPPAFTPAAPGTPDTPARPSRPTGIVQVLIDGTWIRGITLEQNGDQTHVRYFPARGQSQTAWVTADQIRPMTPERMRAEMEMRSNALRNRSSTTPPAANHATPAPSPAPRPTPSQAPTPAPAPTPSPSTPTAQLTLDSAPKLLASPTDQSQVLDFLATTTPDAAHRSKIVAALRPLLDADKSISLPAARALANWSDDATERDVIAGFQNAPREKRRPYFEYLTARKTPAAARAVAARLRISEDVIAAEASLESMGPAAEPPLRTLATDKDTTVAKYAVDTLAAIGTTDSLPTLDQLTDNSDPDLAAAARRAMQRIQSRIH